jgi:DNA-binding PucR family transcriptional regulator
MTDAQGKPLGTLSPATLKAIERGSGDFARVTLDEMNGRLPWFHKLSADMRASIQLIIQSSVNGFIEWFHNPQSAAKLSTETFRNAPRELSRSITLRQTVDLVRISLSTFETHIPELATTDEERTTLKEAVLRYSAEIAFGAATSYASAAEARGAWDARLEALVIDAIVRGDTEESLLSRAAALGWDSTKQATVAVGNPLFDDPSKAAFEIRRWAARAGSRHVLVGLHGSRLVVVMSGETDTTADIEALNTLSHAFGDGPVVIGPTVPDLEHATASAQDALAGLRAVVGWPRAPRPVRSAELLPERALGGDPEAEWQLIDTIAKPLEQSGESLMSTLVTYFDTGGVLEACARELFVHPNTVRYRLKQITALTGRDPANPRDALVLQIALTVGRLAKSRDLW